MLAGMKRLLLPLLVCASSSVLAAAPEFTYLGLPWGSSPAQTTAYLKSRNWEEVKPRQPGSGVYRQRQGGEGSVWQLYTSYKAARLDRVVLICEYDPLPLESALALFHSERDALIQKLGKPVARRDSPQDIAPGVGWNRPGGSLIFGISEANGSALHWTYHAPSRKAGDMADFNQLR